MKITKYKSMTRVKQAVSIASIILLASGPQLQAQTTTDDEVFLNNLLVITGITRDDILLLGDYSFDEINTKKIDVLETEYVYEQRFGKRVLKDSRSSNRTIIDYNPRTNQFSYYFNDIIWSFQCDKRDSLSTWERYDPDNSSRILFLPSRSGSIDRYLPDGKDDDNASKVKITIDPKGRIIQRETWPAFNKDNISVEFDLTSSFYLKYTINLSNKGYVRYNAHNRIEHYTIESNRTTITGEDVDVETLEEFVESVENKVYTDFTKYSFNWRDDLTIKSIETSTGTYYYEITERGADGHWTSMTEYYYDESGNRVNKRSLKRIISDPVEKVRIADAKRREALRQRQARIDSLISIRNTTEFSIEDLNHDRYSRIESDIDSKILSVMEKSIASNGEYSIEDKVRISYDGKTEHDIKITGDSEDLARRVTESVQDMKFKPETIGAPGLDKTVAVNTYDTYEFDYAISMEAENLILVKNADGIKVRKGNAAFYNSNKDWINGHLSENGVYNLDAWKKEINGRIISNDVNVNKIRSRTPNLMLGINYSPIAPIRLIVGYNNIGASPFGIYGKFDNMNSYVVGATCSITNFAYLTCGAGVHKSAILPPELVAEAGIIIRPVPRFGISAGYSYMPGTQSGGFDIGLIISFYLNKK